MNGSPRTPAPTAASNSNAFLRLVHDPLAVRATTRRNLRNKNVYWIMEAGVMTGQRHAIKFLWARACAERSAGAQRQTDMAFDGRAGRGFAVLLIPSPLDDL